MAKGKAVTKEKRKPRRKQCAVKGCRKLRVVRSEFCQLHHDSNDAGQQTVKATQMESLQFDNLDIEIRNAKQGIIIATLEMKDEYNRHKNSIKRLEDQKAQLEGTVQALVPTYMKFVEDLAKRYKIPDATKMTIDPKTGIIRDLSGGK